MALQPQQARREAQTDRAVQNAWDSEAAARSAEALEAIGAWESGQVDQNYIQPDYLQRILGQPLTPEARAKVSSTLTNLRSLNAGGDTLESRSEQNFDPAARRLSPDGFYTDGIDQLPNNPSARRR